MQNLYQSLVAVEPATLIVTIANLFLQLYIIKRFFLDKVLKVLDQRRAAADRELSEAQSAKEEALSIKQAYESNMQQAKYEAGQLLDNARRTATQRSEEILREAQQQAVHIRLKAEADIDLEKKKVLNDAKNEISGLALAIAGKVVERSLDAEDQARLVDRFIDELGENV